MPPGQRVSRAREMYLRLFLEAFELNRGNNWLRGRAVVVVLHQLLGGTIERSRTRRGFSEYAAGPEGISSERNVLEK
jgi:hypothetical protein